MLIASLGVSVAGFAALMYSFRGDASLSRVGAWRIRMIVELGFTAAVLGIGVIVVDAYVTDGKTAIRIASGLFILAFLRPWSFRSLRDPEVYRNRFEKVGALSSSVIQFGLAITNLFLASEGLLLVIYLIVIYNPMSIFVQFVGEIYTPPSRKPHSDG
jgi:hypothetical protein